MKRILLASTALAMLAGAAAAEITWSGEAVLGYNDDDPIGPDDDNQGFYWELDIDVVLSQTLDNGLTAGAEFGFEVADDNTGQVFEGSDYVLFLESDTASLFFGDTAFAAETHWDAAGDMESDGFSEQDGEVVIRGDLTFGNVEGSISYAVTDADGDIIGDNSSDDVDQLSIAAVGTFANFTVGFAYQEESIGTNGAYDPSVANGDFNEAEIFGIFASTSFGGADIALAYASDQTNDEDSLGIEVAYPVGPVTLTGYYVSESEAAGDNWGINVAYEEGPVSVELDYQDDQGTEKVGLEGSYDVGNGIVVRAGYLTEDATEDRFYIAGEYDLGGGAELLISYAEDDSNVDEDEIGDPEYQRGTTVEVSFEF